VSQPAGIRQQLFTGARCKSANARPPPPPAAAGKRRPAQASVVPPTSSMPAGNAMPYYEDLPPSSSVLLSFLPPLKGEAVVVGMKAGLPCVVWRK